MDYLFVEKLKICAENVFFDEPMSKHTTFHTGGACDYFVEASSLKEVVSVVNLCKEHGVKFAVIGRGSNILVKDDGFRGLVLAIGAKMSEITIRNDVIFAEAGASLANLAAVAMENGVTGFEPLSGIPGLIGGAVRMNAGAYNGEVKDVLLSVTFVENGNIVTISANEAKLSYRNSLFCHDKNKIIVAAEFSAKNKKDKADIALYMNELARRRREKQPLEYPSAGSTFKRPEGYFAAKLIEDCGLKGYKVGGAMVSEKHAGFVINAGGATSSDVLAVIKHVQDTVYGKTGVMLETEIEIL